MWEASGVCAIAAVGRAAAGLDIGGVPGVGAKTAQRGRRVEGASAHFHVIGLQDHAALPSPIGMQGQDQILEGKRFACRHRWSPEITALKMTVDCGATWRSEGAWRSEERRVGEGCVSTCRCRGSRYH